MVGENPANPLLGATLGVVVVANSLRRVTTKPDAGMHERAREGGGQPSGDRRQICVQGLRQEQRKSIGAVEVDASRSSLVVRSFIAAWVVRVVKCGPLAAKLGLAIIP